MLRSFQESVCQASGVRLRFGSQGWGGRRTRGAGHGDLSLYFFERHLLWPPASVQGVRGASGSQRTVKAPSQRSKHLGGRYRAEGGVHLSAAAATGVCLWVGMCVDEWTRVETLTDEVSCLRLTGFQVIYYF